ncbi:Hypothetical predicted protein [Paramuricea clavata]|uniref:Uncharacterized protein n=1 Tax=Paramuricea clavata TaxID=317549 RepID=A0A6S7HEV7_PARCT|nr:Hypothetical predicted protein [Paramuricea clavata]
MKELQTHAEIKFTRSHLAIPIAQTSGNDTKCLKNQHRITPCRTLKYALQYTLASNETSVNIIFVEDYRFSRIQPLQIHTNENQTLIFSKLPDYVPPLTDINLNCSRDAHGIFDVYGPNLILEFHNIIFANCGQGNEDVMPVILAKYTKKVSFYSCIFRDNVCGAFFAINTDIHIEYSRFQNNSFHSSERLYKKSNDVSAFSGGVGILFQYERRNMSVNVFYTIFIDNRVHVDDSKYYVARKPENAVENGGAMHVTFINKSTFWTTINITSCYFESNKATFGGALLIELFGTTLYNKIFISSTHFIRNYGSQAGGAFLLSLWGFSAKTELTMVDSVFFENWSKSGGAIYVILQSNYSLPHENKEILLFKRLNVSRNAGPAASSVKIVSHLFGPRSVDQVPIFENCSFMNNTNGVLNGYAQLASFIMDRVNIEFHGTNTFSGNTVFGAVYFSNSYIHVYGKLHFLGNVGLQGGAISMQNSQIVVHPGSELLFQDNYATFGGGAIDVVTNGVYHVGVINNQFCFLVYSEHDKIPNEWKVTIKFINNSAALRGPAICIDSLLMCAWDSNSKKVDFYQALKWKPTFHYEGNVLCPDPGIFQQCHQSANGTNGNAISTFASTLQERNGMQTIKTCPGEEAVLDIIAKDELNNSVFTVIADKLPSLSWLSSPESFTAIQPHGSKVRFKYTYNADFVIPINQTIDVYYYDLFSVGRVSKRFTLRPQPCRPGFVQKNGSCVCDRSKTGILGCTTDGHYVQYKEGYWVGVVDHAFTIFPCPFGYCSCPKPPQHGTATSGCFFNAVNRTDHEACANRRFGTLCDNELRGPLFFFQVLPLFFPPVQTQVTFNVYNFVVFLASIFDFTIPFFGYFFSKCYILNDQDNLDMLAWSYSSSVIASLVFLVALLLSYKRVILIRRKNAVQCFWVLLILMYSSLMMTSLRIVDCPLIQGKFRLYLQASVTCRERTRHIVLSIVAYILLAGGIVIPMLIVVSTKTNRLKIAPHYLDTLTNKLKEGRVFWWSVDLLRRFLIVALGNLIHIWKEKQVALVLAATFILSIHCYFQPYEETRANISEMIFLFVLSGLGIFQLMDIDDADRDKTNLAIVCIMLFYTIILVAIKLVVFVQNRTKPAVDNEGYERLEGEPSTSATSPTIAVTDQSLEERREKLAFLFSRSESPRPKAERRI